jgi:hypothetical protein
MTFSRDWTAPNRNAAAERERLLIMIENLTRPGR